MFGAVMQQDIVSLSAIVRKNENDIYTHYNLFKYTY